MVYQAGNNGCLGRNQSKKYKLVISRYILFVHAELVEVVILEALVLVV
jgi:hypothetical protein